MTAFDASWDSFWQGTGLSERTIFVLGLWATHMVVFWGYNIFLYFCYKFDLFSAQKIEKGVFPAKDLVQETLKTLIINHLIVQPVAFYYLYLIFAHFGTQVYSPLPTWRIIIRDIIVSIAFNDTFFYWIHRLLHHPAIYKYIHKQHHRYNHSIGIACEFAHPVEDVFANFFPSIGGCMFLGSHVFTLWLWLAIRLWETLDVHSGYSFQWSPFHLFLFQGGPDRHYFHHSHNVGCYGSFTIFWDWITGNAF